MDSNIVTFPGAEQLPIAETDIEARHAEAFRDLENRLLDCVSMSKIAFDLICEHKTEDREWFLRSPIRGNCWKNSRKTISPRGTTRGREDCTRPQPRPARCGKYAAPNWSRPSASLAPIAGIRWPHRRATISGRGPKAGRWRPATRPLPANPATRQRAAARLRNGCAISRLPAIRAQCSSARWPMRPAPIDREAQPAAAGVTCR